MISEQNLFELNTNFNTKASCITRLLILLFIPTLIYIAVLASYMHYIPLKMEMHSVILIGFIYFIYLFFIRHNAYLASCSFKKRFADMKIELLAYMNKHRVNINETVKANASIDDFLAEFTRNLRNSNFSSVAAGIFPTLGILGTFISIAITMPDFSSKTSAVLEQEISILLSGVGTAFYVSIYGIFLSIWWIFFEKLGMSRFEHDVQIIKESTKELFWNKVEIEKIQFQKSMENFEKLNSVFEQMGQEELERVLTQSMKKKAMLFDNLIEQESNLLEQSKTFHDFNQQKHQQIMQSYEKVVDQLNRFSPVLEEALKHTTLITKHFNKQERDLQEISKQLNENIILLNDSLSNISAQSLEKVSHQIIKNMEVMKNDTDKIGWRLNQQLDDFDEGLNKKLANSLEQIDKETATIVEQLSSLKE